MVSIPLHEGTVTLNHEWPLEVHVEAYKRQEPLVSLEVDTDLGTAVVGLTMTQLEDLIDAAGDLHYHYLEVKRVARES